MRWARNGHARVAANSVLPCEPAHINLPQTVLFIDWRGLVCNMESRPDIVTITSAVGVAAYVAIAAGHVAHYNLGFSLQGVRSGAVVIAVVIAALLVIDFFGKKLGKAK